MTAFSAARSVRPRLGKCPACKSSNVYAATGDLSAAIDSVASRNPPARACSPFLRQVCECLGVTPAQLLRGGRAPRFADARHVAAWVCREATGASYPEIGKSLGGFHHTSVLHGVRRVERTPELLAKAREILAAVQARKAA